MPLVTVDLDETLMHSSHDYKNAREDFTQWMHTEFGFDPELVNDLVQKIDREQLDGMGLSLERFPQSFRKTTRRLVENPSEETLETAEDIGHRAFKTKEEYAERGFIDGAEEMLNQLYGEGPLHLITAGVPELQNKKIEALELDRWFDDTHVVEMYGKSQKIQDLLNKYDISLEETFHIGNSESSDVQSAIDAGVNAVYIPYGQWRGTSGTDYTTHSDVYVFDNVAKFAEKAPSVINNSEANI